MESVVDKFEALVRKAESDLNYVSLRLDSQVARQFAKNGNDQLNPIKLLDRIKKAREELKNLSKETSELYSEQNEVQSSLISCLLPVQHLLQNLQQQTGCQVSTKTDEQEFLEQQCKENIGCTSGFESLSPDLKKTCIEDGKENLNLLSNAETEYREQEKLELRRRLKEYVAVTEQEFNNVSQLIRGRTTLDGVNKVHEVLFNYFKTNRKRPPLTLPNMTKMGLKITGATGQAKLKVLRALKIIQITNQGAVQWQT